MTAESIYKSQPINVLQINEPRSQRGENKPLTNKMIVNSINFLIKKIDIIGIPVTALPFQKQIEIIFEWAQNRESRYICVANTHMLVEAHKNKLLFNILKLADLVTPDGMPLVWMMKILGSKNQDRVAGQDLMNSICKTAQERGISVYFVGSQKKILDLMRKRLHKEFPDLKIMGMEPLPFSSNVPVENSELIQKINKSAAGIVLVSLGCPKQEHWMANHKNKIKAVMVGVGGVFPVYAGIKRQTPYYIRICGLEWLFRLIQEPRRLWRRYVLTIPMFIFLALWQLLLGQKNRSF